MALDRRITIKIEAIGTRDSNGTYIPGPVAEYPVWAERRSAGSSDQATSGGFITQSAQNYIVRWFQALELADISLVEVEDEFGITWDADSVSPSDARRRLITLQVLRST